MIGAVPPAAISDWRYVAVSILAGLITFYWYRIINRLSSPVLVIGTEEVSLGPSMWLVILVQSGKNQFRIRPFMHQLQHTDI